LGQFLIMLAGGKLFFIMLLAMILSTILGMGMSTVPAYVIAAAVVAPALVQAGVPVMAAHLFVLYYAIISTITPPIAISAFTAAAIADSDPLETALKSVRLAISGYIIPFLFVYRPPLLAQGTNWEIVYTAVITLIAIYALSRGIQYRLISKMERLFMIVGAAVLLFPYYDLLGIVLILIGFLFTGYQKYIKGRKSVNV
ncbi:MAG TPA: TRAP transporter large permease subunit, partial [Clostridia bacterium]|nr:TRAP transporter large permease subunit [Clostridia bacterium]